MYDLKSNYWGCKFIPLEKRIHSAGDVFSWEEASHYVFVTCSQHTWSVDHHWLTFAAGHFLDIQVCTVAEWFQGQELVRRDDQILRNKNAG